MRDVFGLEKLLLTLASVLLVQVCVAQTAPDVVFINGKVLMVDEIFSEVQAVAVTGNRISAVGATAEISVLADLVVLDRDYMTVPVEEIRNLKSVLTMVDGRIVYDAAQD